jgi:hypothetical protein
MASGAEILSYQGNPALALGSSDLPATSSVYVSDFDKAFQYWQNYAQRKFIADKAKWDQNNAERAANQKRLEDAISLGNYDIWDVDKDNFMKYYEPMREMAIKDPTSVYDSNNPNFFKFNELLGKTKQAAAFSTQQKAEFDTRQKLINEHPETILNLDAPEKYKNAGGIYERAQLGGINLQPNFELNLLSDQDKLLKTLQYDNPTLEVTQGQHGNDLYTITQEPNLENTRKIIEAEYDSGISVKRGIQQMINENPEIIQGFANPKDLYMTMRIAALPLDEKTKVELRGRVQPSAAALKQQEGSDQGYLNEFIRRIQNKDSDVLKSLSGTLDGHLISSVNYVKTSTEPLIKQRDKLYTERDAIKGDDEPDIKSRAEKQSQIDELTKQIAKTKDEPTTIQITFSDDQKPIKIPIPPASEGQQGGAYYTLNALLRKIEKENNFRVQDVAGDIFGKPERTENKTVTSPNESGIQWKK